MPKRVAIRALRNFNKQNGLLASVLYAWDGELSHVVSHGKTIELCSVAADIGNDMKKLLGWPDSSQAQPSRVRKLQSHNAEMRKTIEQCQDAFGRALAVYRNDRSSTRADELIPTLQQGFDLCVQILSKSGPPQSS